MEKECDENMHEKYRSLYDSAKDRGMLWDWGYQTVYLIKNSEEFEFVSDLVRIGCSRYSYDRKFPRIHGVFKGPGWYQANRIFADPYDEYAITDFELEFFAPYITERN